MLDLHLDPVDVDATPPDGVLFRSFVEPPFMNGGDGRYVAICPITGEAADGDAIDLRLLLACRTFAPLAVHARRGCLALGLSLDQEAMIRDRLGRLAAAGLLVSYQQVDELFHAGPRLGPAPVTVVGIPTRDRPEMLARCVADLARAVRAAGREMELVVADGSPQEAMRVANRQVLESIRDAFPGQVVYARACERERYAAELIQAGADPDATRFALLPDANESFAAGANRNLLALYAAGRVLLQLDDDTLSRCAAVPEARPGLALTCQTDPTEFWFLPESAPTDGGLGEPADLAGLHETLLGRELADCVAAGPLDLDEIDSTFLLRLRAAGGRVRVTTAGVAGDSGMGATLYHLMLRGASRERLHRTEAIYRTAMSGGLVLRAATQPTITRGSVCMGLNLGLDLRTPLPPFPPVLRNEDGVFGAVVQTCCPAVLMGHLPSAVWHLPSVRRSYPSDALNQWADELRPEHLFVAFVRACAPATPPADERRNLRILGEGLIGLGSLPAEEFRALTRATAWELVSGMAGQLSQLLEEHDAKPEWWADDMRHIVGRFGSAVRAKHYGTPLDSHPEHSLARLQSRIRRYGQLLTHWYDVLDAARAIGSSARQRREWD